MVSCKYIPTYLRKCTLCPVSNLSTHYVGPLGLLPVRSAQCRSTRVCTLHIAVNVGSLSTFCINRGPFGPLCRPVRSLCLIFRPCVGPPSLSSVPSAQNQARSVGTLLIEPGAAGRHLTFTPGRGWGQLLLVLTSHTAVIPLVLLPLPLPARAQCIEFQR